VSATPEFEALPRMIERRNITFSSLFLHTRFLFSHRPGGDLVKSQGLILIEDLDRTIDPILDLHLGGLRLVLDLIKLLVMGYRKVLSESPGCFNA
jgi:hypothetical protein